MRTEILWQTCAVPKQSIVSVVLWSAFDDEVSAFGLALDGLGINYGWREESFPIDATHCYRLVAQLVKCIVKKWKTNQKVKRDSECGGGDGCEIGGVLIEWTAQEHFKYLRKDRTNRSQPIETY